MKSNQKEQGKNGSSGIVIAALRGGSGKTIFSVGIISALIKSGITVAPFKKGPDYIDAGWLALAAGRPCYNLDTYLIDKPTILDSFQRSTCTTDLAVIEGNRGLYDSIDRKSKTSTAELAKWLDLPVLLCIDGTKATRTMAAVVLGCIHFDPEVKIRGVILNRVAGKRHQQNLMITVSFLHKTSKHIFLSQISMLDDFLLLFNKTWNIIISVFPAFFQPCRLYFAPINCPTTPKYSACFPSRLSRLS